MATSPKRWRFDAKSVFLTYPRCSETKESLLEFLQSKFTVEKYIISSENHSDGGLHLHALITFVCPLRTRDNTIFDFNRHHPNIQSPRHLKKTYEYVAKDNDYIENGYEFKNKSDWTSVFEATSKEEFLSKAKAISPRDYCLALERLEYAADKLFRPVKPPYKPKYSLDSFLIPHALNVFKDQMNDDRPKSLLIVGPSRLGKTQLIKTMFPIHTYWYQYIDLRSWNDSASLLILDDFEWDKIPCKKGLIGAQETIVLTDKYCRKKTIDWGKPCVILMNDLPLLDQWDRANLIVLVVREKLFIE